MTVPVLSPSRLGLAPLATFGQNQLVSSGYKPYSPLPPSVSALKPLYPSLGPVQASTLFVAGLATAQAAVFVKTGWRQPPWKQANVAELKKSMGAFLKEVPTEALQSNHPEMEVSKVSWASFDQGLLSVIPYVMAHPIRALSQRLGAYVGSSVLGYVLGSAADGLQEIWVRREETQIRAGLLAQMTDQFRGSIQQKVQQDNVLRQSAKQQIMTMLAQCNIPYPQELIHPTPDVSVDRLSRYPYEPTHFSRPQRVALQYRFAQQAYGVRNNQRAFNEGVTLRTAKSVIFLAGLATGLLANSMMALIRNEKPRYEKEFTASKAALQQAATASTKKAVQNPGLRKAFQLYFNITNMEALFVTQPRAVIALMLGLTAAAKLGKSLIDGYREIEVTRQNANTELKYQYYNWGQLDPTFHQIAEEEALQESLQHLREAIPHEWQNRALLGQRIQTILSNIGRNSAPKYFQMTPPVNLAAARS